MNLNIIDADTGLAAYINNKIQVALYDRFILSMIHDNFNPILNVDLVRVYHTTFNNAFFVNGLSDDDVSALLACSPDVFTTFFYNSVASKLKEIIARWNIGAASDKQISYKVPTPVMSVIKSLIQLVRSSGNQQVWALIKPKIDIMRFSLKISPATRHESLMTVDPDTAKQIEQALMSLLVQLGSGDVVPEAYRPDKQITASYNKEFAGDRGTILRFITNIVECMIMLQCYQCDATRLSYTAETSINERITASLKVRYPGMLSIDNFIKYSHIPVGVAICMVPNISYILSKGNACSCTDTVKLLGAQILVHQCMNNLAIDNSSALE